MRYFSLLLGLLLIGQTPGLDRTVPRGRKTVLHPVPGGRPAEICVEPRHIPHANYRGPNGSEDEKTEDRLCSYDFYSDGPTSKTGAIATCPHARSTSGSIEFQEIPKDRRREELQTKEACGLHRPTDKLTRFKTSDYDAATTFAPGAMLAYHVSRMFGDILLVPPTVLRTVDLAVMKDVAQRAPAVVTNDLVRKSFANYLVAIKDPAKYKIADIFTTDHQQLYGFLSAKVKGDTIYPGWATEITNEKFEAEGGVKDAFSDAPATSLFGKTITQASLQRLLLARDFADLIVFDEVMSQGDRLTGLNLSSVWFYYYPSHGRLESVEKHDVDKGKKPMPAGAMLVRRLLSTDNDCVVICGNDNAARNYSARLRHLHPRTYAGVMQLAAAWRSDAALKNQLAVDLAMPADAMDKFGAYLQKVATTLHDNCVSGKLKLDLDPDVVFGLTKRGENNVELRQRCS